MKTENRFLSKLLCNIFIIAIFTFNGFGQNNKKNIPGNITEKKAEKSEYIVHDQRDFFVLYNKKNSLMIYESDFDRRRSFKYVDEIISFKDSPKIDSLVYKIIAPFYHDFTTKYKVEFPSFNIVFYAKPDGKVCELLFSFNQYANVPFKAIEKLENEILALGLKLEFDPTSYFVKDVLWVYYPYSISVTKMKEKLKEKEGKK